MFVYYREKFRVNHFWELKGYGGNQRLFCSEVILTLNSLLFSHVGEREGNKKITTGIQYTMVFTASYPVTSGFCRKDILLFPFYCQKVVQERCM